MNPAVTDRNDGDIRQEAGAWSVWSCWTLLPSSDKNRSTEKAEWRRQMALHPAVQRQHRGDTVPRGTTGQVCSQHFPHRSTTAATPGWGKWTVRGSADGSWRSWTWNGGAFSIANVFSTIKSFRAIRDSVQWFPLMTTIRSWIIKAFFIPLKQLEMVDCKILDGNKLVACPF